MIVIIKDAEATFLNEIDFLMKRSTQRRCLYIRFSMMPQQSQGWFYELSRSLEDIAEGHVGQAYICADHDVFVIMPHLTDKHLQKFIAAAGHIPKALCTLHEIRDDYELLKNAASRKINMAEKTDAPALPDAEYVPGIQEKRVARHDIDILICEDDALARMMIKNVLMHDFRVHLAKDAGEAIALYPDIAPDVVFLDIGLPDANGEDILQHFMRIDPQANIIMFSGRQDQDTILKALRHGASGFVGKPFSRGKLYQYIEQCPSVQQKRENGGAFNLGGS
ncbi:MAG TPA: response regulator [Alphaproteobacteria bacterium]|nr:response regulator [Alphaproteobacteria bacterium]